MSDDENLLSEKMRAAFAAVELHAGFAERVTRAWLDEQASAAASRWRPPAPLVLGALTLAAAGVMLLLLRPPVRPRATIRPPAVTTPAATPGATPLPAVAPRRPSLPDTPDALYAAADRQLAAHAWPEARRLFGAFVGLYPSDWRVDRAQYQIGETYAGEKRFAEAIGAYTQVIERAPDSEAAADAMYRTGVAFAALKHCSDAKAYFEQLRARHPRSAWEKDLDARLLELKRARSDNSRCED